MDDYNYKKMTPRQRLLCLQQRWKDEPTGSHNRTILEGRMLEASIGLDEHPEEFQHGCLCDLCRSYGNS